MNDRQSDSTPPPSDPWLRLEKLVEAELRLSQVGKLTEVFAAIQATGAHIATLPQTAPRSARPHILRARALRSRLEIELRRSEAQLQRQRQARARAQRLRRRYTPGRSEYSINV